MLSASKDWNVVVWDLAARHEPMQRLRTVRFDSPVVSAAFHPRNRCVYALFFKNVRTYKILRV